jgi:hypothetical protein
MSQTKQILLAFLIPFILGVSLAFLGFYIFPLGCFTQTVIRGEIVCIGESWIEIVNTLLIWGLFVTSLILPPFLTKRAYQSKRSSLNTTSIIE